MTFKELKQVPNLKKEVRFYEQKLREIKSGHPSKQEVKALCKKIRLLEFKIKHLENYVASISDKDCLIRFALTAYCFEGEPWTKVALLMGGNNTAAGAEKACRRYLKKH